MTNPHPPQQANAVATVLPPHDPDAEQALLGAVLINSDVIGEIEDTVSPDDFYIARHRWIWEAVLGLRKRDLEVDITTVASALGQERLQEAGGPPYLTRLVANTPSSLHAVSYAKMVAEYSARRKLLEGMASAAKQAYNTDVPFDDVLEDAEHLVFRVAQKMVGGGLFQQADELVSTLLDRLEGGKPPQGLRTGLSGLDKIIRMSPGDFIVLAGRPGNGKTSLLLQIAEHAAIQEHISTAVFSLEMPGESLMNRITSQLSGIPLTHLRNNGLTQQEWALLAETAGVVAESPLYINDAPGLTATQVRSQCMRLASSSGGLGLVVIDYLQLMSGGGKYRSRVDEVTEISRSMKALAREIDAPVLAAAQLSRAVEQRQDKRPMLSDLRESGSIEQDADIVMFVYPRGDDKSQKFISVDKHRNGPTGTIEATFHGSTVSFS